VEYFDRMIGGTPYYWSPRDRTWRQRIFPNGAW
jgi:hypothetical protein